MLEVAHNYGLEHLMPGTCGQCVACASCHVILEENTIRKFPIEDEMEADVMADVLDDQQTEQSRLGCQVKVSKRLAKATVTIPLSNNFKISTVA